MNNRLKNSLVNMKTSFIMQIINKLMAFIVRTIFIQSLNTEYLGVNGLFTNILTMLSFAELGVGTAIIYSLYKPIADNDTEKIKSLMQLYKKSYNIIGTVIFILGILLIPFLDIIITEIPNIKENIILIYILFLLNSTVSYFFTYKKSLIIAYQKQSIINKIDSIYYICKSLTEILFLVLTKNYIVFLLIQICGTLVENFVVSLKANKLYPILKEKKSMDISPHERKNIFANVKSLVVYQLGSVIMNGTDNILISSIINVKAVGICSNYMLIISSVKNIVQTTVNSITASIGNLNVTSSSEKKEDIFHKLIFINFIIYSICAIILGLCLNVFIELWLGPKYILNQWVANILAFNFFIEGIRQPCFIFRTAMGLFNKSKITPYIGAISNITLSILLGKKIGLEGIFLATIISQLISYSWIDPYLIYKYEFKSDFTKYLKKNFLYFAVFIVEFFMSLLIADYMNLGGLQSLIFRISISVFITIGGNIIIFRKSKELQYFKKLLLKKVSQ